MRTAKILAVSALAAGLVALFLRGADLARVGQEIGRAQPGLIAVAVGLTVLLYVVRAERWLYMLAPIGVARFRHAFSTTAIGFAASAVLPARAGEVLRPLLLARKEGLAATAVFATIVVERILDLSAVLLLLACYLLFFDTGMAMRAPALYQAVRLGAYVTASGSVLVLAVMMALAADPTRVERWLLAVSRRLPPRAARALASMARAFAEGLAIVRRPSRLVGSLARSLVLWIIIGTQVWLVSHAFALPIPYAGAYLQAALLVVGVALPTPGGVGGFHEAFRLGATSFFGADNDAAVGAAIVLHAVSFVPVMVMGLWFTFAEGLDIGRLRQMARRDEEAGPLRSGSVP